ncbi:MAG TPA: AAA family ATPase [Phycisphaerales bacterium]|nr:AAA family ATPase [Phycisphaerales bacterium]
MQGRTETAQARLGGRDAETHAERRAHTAPRGGIPGGLPGGPRNQTSNTGPFISSLRAEIGDDVFNRYLGRSDGLRLDDDGLRMTVPNRFIADMIENRFAGAIRRALSACGRPETEPLRIEIAPPGREAPRRTRQPDPVPAKPAPRRPLRRPVHTFDSFIVGQCNRLAFETARRFARADADGGFQGPLFLFGPSGVGKSHLLAAIASRFSEHHPGARTRRLTAESFTNEYFAAIRSNTIESFHRKYRRIKLLCIDDVHYLAKKTATQNELLHTFDALDLGGARIVLASDAHPRQIRQLNAALVSRFISGSLVEIEPPDRVTACRLVVHFAAGHGISLDEEAVRIVAESACPDAATPSVRDLLGAVNRLLAYIRITRPDFGGPVDAAAASAALRLGDPDREVPARPVPIDHIVAAVCEAVGVTRPDLAGRGRHKAVVLGRSLIALLARRLTKRSYPEIASAIGLKSHSTVIAGHNRLKAGIERGDMVDAGLQIDGTPLSILVNRLDRALRSRG